MKILSSNGASLVTGRLAGTVERYVRLNFINGGNGAPTSALTNILLVNADGVWIKLHEGEVIDLGPNPQQLEYDFFPNQFPSLAGNAPTRANFELQMSSNPLESLRGKPCLFVDGSTVSLDNITTTLSIKAPPNFVLASKNGCSPQPVVKRIRINNNSGTLLNILNAPLGAVIDTIAVAAIYDEEHRDSIYVMRGGANATFFYQTFFEWI
jgi:hypothetical protein